MSGIAAVLSLDGSAVPQSEVERMANALKPYGPDRQKVLMHGNAAFVFCLHQFTPEDLFEQQPLLLANRFVMLFDGRIDNRSELGEALNIAAPDLNAMADSAIVLRLFDRWGERAFERILGEFAVIVMDILDGRLICARDQMGLRVLHYHRSATRFAVATAPEPLFALSWVPRILNKDKVGDALINAGLNGETTYYQEIHRVLPGCIVGVRGANFSKVRFWTPENIADVRFKTDDEYVEAFREHLDRAVRARLRCTRTPCSMISGGLDSSSIAVTAADILAASGKKLNTFTAVPEAGFQRDEMSRTYFDETPYVRQIASFNPNIVPYFVPPSKGPILDQIAEQVRVGGTPRGSILNGLWCMDICSAARAAGHNVMLTGDMGNFTMSANGWELFAELFRRGRWLRLFSEIKASDRDWEFILRNWIILPFVSAPLYGRYRKWRDGGKPRWHDFSALNRGFAARSGVVAREARENLPFDAPPPRFFWLPPRVNANKIRSYAEAADWFTKLRAHFGVDFRTPAFDRRLVEFCFGIPVDQYLHKGCDRWLIRRGMKGRLPDAVLYNKKRGRQAADWHPRLTRERYHIAEKVQRLAGNGDVASIVDLPRLAVILDNWPARQPSGMEELDLMRIVPEALGAACFIENVTAANSGRSL